MKIVLIGSGNVATHLGEAFKRAGNEIVQVYSRTLAHAVSLSTRLRATPVDMITAVITAADLYLFCVKDDILQSLAEQMPRTSGVWAHTSGSMPLSVLSSHPSIGVIYPLQTFSKDRELNCANIPFFIEGIDAATLSFLQSQAQAISMNVRELSSEKRRVLHLSAVFACNFSNHMYALAAQILQQEDLPFTLLNPLITETAAKVEEMHPFVAQTGPAVRFDKAVMRKHLELLSDPKMREIYIALSENIHVIAQSDHS